MIRIVQTIFALGLAVMFVTAANAQTAGAIGNDAVFKDFGGKDMKTVHHDMGLRNADFNAPAEDLQQAMDKNGVPSRAQNKL